MRLDPPNLDDLRQKIYAAIEEMGSEESLRLLGELGTQMPQYLAKHLAMIHTVPSPSSVMDCRLQQWFKVREYEPDVVIPAAWLKRAAAGVVIEPYWMAILSSAGLPVTLPDKPWSCGLHMRAHPDGYIGDNALLELKDKTGWGYKKLIEGNGIAYEEPNEYMQCQLYLHASGRDWALYLASPADTALLQSLMRQWKKYGKSYDLPLVYLEIVQKREQDILVGLARGDMIHEDAQSDAAPPREYDGVPFKKDGVTKSFPCGYCIYQPTCKETYG